MHVLIVHGYGLEGSGSSIYARSLAEHLLTSGKRVTILCQSTGRESAGENRVRDLGAQIRYMPKSTLTTLYPRKEFADAPHALKLSEFEMRAISSQVTEMVQQVIDEDPPDAVVSNHILAISHGASVAAARANIPMSIVSHGTDIEYGCTNSEILTKLGKESAKNVRQIVALNHFAATRISETIGVPISSLALQAPGTNTSVFQPHDAWERAEQVAMVGRVVLDKGTHVGIAALLELLEKRPNLKCAIVGDGPDLKILKEVVAAISTGSWEKAEEAFCKLATNINRARMVSESAASFFSEPAKERLVRLGPKVAEAISFEGYCDSQGVASILRKSRVALLPSLVPECYPLSLVEAASCGAFVVAAPKGATLN